MSCSRKDFIEATTIAGQVTPSFPRVREAVTRAFIQFFKNQNPRFDEARFRAYVERIASSDERTEESGKDL